MAPMKKILISLAIVGIVIAAVYVTAITYEEGNWGGNFDDIKPGAPDPTIIVTLIEVGTGNDQSATLPSLSVVKPLTTLPATLFAVNPNSIYTLDFNIRYTVEQPAGLPAGTAMVGYATLEGYCTIAYGTHYFINQNSYAATGNYMVTTASTPLINNTGTSLFSDGLKFDKGLYTYTNTVEPILGSMLDNAAWALICHAQTTYVGTNAYYGSTTVTINMSLGGENLVVTATGVDVTVTTP